MSFGVTPAGFVRKTLEDILSEIESDERVKIDAGLDVQPETPIGQLNGIFAAKLAEVWEQMEAINANQYPDSASDFGLVGVASLTGTFPAAATKGTVVLKLTLGAAVTVPAGSVAAVFGDPTNRWVTTVAVTSVLAGVFTVAAEAELAGNISAAAATITLIVTPVAGWTLVTNDADAIEGTEIDTDAQLRIRREQELSLAGSTTINAIRADLLQVEDVTSVTVFHNPTDFTDANGLPPHTVEALVLGGTNQAVADALFDTVAGGIDTFGGFEVTVIATQGTSHLLRFSRPTAIDILVEIDLDISTDYPATGDAAVADAIKLYVDGLPVGNDVFLSQINGPAIGAAEGIIDVTAIRIGSVLPAVAPVAVDYTIEARELAEMTLSANVTVTTSPGSP